MLERIQPILNSSGFRYLLIGGLGFLAEILIIRVAQGVFGASAVIAVGISFWVGTLASFLLQKLFAFRNTQRTTVALTKQSVSFAILVAVNYVFTLAFVALTAPIWSSPELSRAIALVITTGWNYLAYRFIVFR